jgi:hypothetical protein
MWPGGTRQRFTNVKVNTQYSIDESAGLTPWQQAQTSK